MKANADTVIRLNLGSGPNGAPGWLHYDWGVLPMLSKAPWLRKMLIKVGALSPHYDMPWPDIRLVDIRKKWPLRDGTVGCIYSSQVLEHVERWEALRILREAHRILQDGGCFRIVVPDIKKMCRGYLEDPGIGSQTGAAITAGTRFNRLIFGYEKDIEPSGWMQRLARRFIRDHAWHYDERDMEILCREAGFSAVRHCSFREGTVPDLELLDLEIHEAHSLYVEAVK